MTERIAFVVGAGGHGRECLGVWRRQWEATRGVSSGRAEPRFLVDDQEPPSEVLMRLGAEWLGTLAVARTAASSAEYVIGVGSGAIRERLYARASPNWVSPTVVHPMSAIDGDVRMRDGVVVFAFATVTTNIDIGLHSHIGRGSAIGHDCAIGDFVTVMPLASVSGGVHIGDRATIGAGAVVRQGQRIGEDAFVGAGAVVVSDVPPRAVVVGNPAREIT